MINVAHFICGFKVLAAGCKSVSRWNVAHTVTSVFSVSQTDLDRENTLICKMWMLQYGPLDWHDLPQLSQLPKGEPAMKHWFTSAVHTKPAPPLTAPPAAPVGQHEAFTKDKRTSWIFMFPTLPETQQNSLRSAPRNPHCAKTHKYTRAVQYACVVVVLLSLSIPFSDIPPAHAHPNVETHAREHARTWIHLHAFMFTRSGCWILWSTSSLFPHQLLCPQLICNNSAAVQHVS